MRVKISLIALLMLAPACGNQTSSKTDKAAPAGKAEAAAKDCPVEQSLDQRLAQPAASQHGGLDFYDVPEVAANVGQQVPKDGVLVRVESGSSMLSDGKKIDAAADESPAKSLAAALAGSKEVYVSAAAFTKLSDVYGFLAELEEANLRLVVRPASAGPSPFPEGTPPRVQKVLESIRGTDPAMRAQTIAKHLSSAIEGCRPMVKLFETMATVAPEQRAQQLRGGLLEAAKTCTCHDYDSEMLVGLYDALVVDMQPPPIHWLPLPRPGSPNYPAELDDKSTMEDLVRVLTTPSP